MENNRPRSSESSLSPLSGWPVLIGLVAAEALLITALAQLDPNRNTGWIVLGTAVGGVGFLLTLVGFFVVNPNMSRVMVLFGRYRGTVRTDGFWWINPFTSKHKVSLKAHNMASQKIKVNDQVGNPIEIGAVVVWRIADTAQAMFDVEDYEEYVDIQVEAAVRKLASSHPYDEHDTSADVVSLRGDTEQVTGELQVALGERLERAGVEVVEARISHLAYAPEIASAMLQRQQAQAIIAARRQIVEGAVGMVQDALELLKAGDVVELDDERRATLVGNLLVVLCSQESAQPVLNTGSLYN
ncbi:SPFH domain-containing protein [Engelhardtia mirabilis]|uniref:SPFH domain / Band 7 family protein n=1 Tax=Engelhardtia mirabilis TaxID=2528011 RepID=A0A518BF06_9BACT|nr:SPFH domain / Band 7 family protein [Planctomycetes bacterium Pla133]QDU99894.1 SPFH domain / Band 7 family protein [Planctomycetes bacterium Pla86]